MTWAEFAAAKTDLLDVRERPAKAIESAVNIPPADLSEAGAELPHRERLLRIANTGPEAAEAVKQLSEAGRSACLEPQFAYGRNQRTLRLWDPNEFLEEVAPNLSAGNALDLACGCGRESVALAACGWRVSAVDQLSDALARAESLAARFGFAGRVDWLQADLIDPSFDLRPYSPNLAITFFYLDRLLIPRIIGALAPGASFLLETFTQVHREAFGKPRREELATSGEELTRLAQGCEICHCSEGWRSSGRHTVRLWARRH